MSSAFGGRVKLLFDGDQSAVNGGGLRPALVCVLQLGFNRAFAHLVLDRCCDRGWRALALLDAERLQAR